MTYDAESAKMRLLIIPQEAICPIITHRPCLEGSTS